MTKTLSAPEENFLTPLVEMNVDIYFDKLSLGEKQVVRASFESMLQ